MNGSLECPVSADGQTDDLDYHPIWLLRVSVVLDREKVRKIAVCESAIAIDFCSAFCMMQFMTRISSLFRQAGGIVHVARQIGLPLGTVSAWVTRNKIPAERVLHVECLTGISRHELRPDLYPKEQDAS